MKYLANMISISRILFIIGLLFSLHEPLPFIILYFACGLSDVLDGYVARKTNTQSELGAKLDSIADLFFFTVLTAAIILWLGNRLAAFFPWLIAIILIRCANLAIAAYKYRTFAILHTWGNKITGFLLFAAPPMFIISRETAVFWPVCVFAALSALEESTIHLTSKTLDLNRQSIFKK